MTALEQGMGGLALTLGLALLCLRRIDLALACIAGQAIAVSVALAADDTGAALANAMLSGLAVPLLLRGICPATEPASERQALATVLAAACVLGVIAAGAGSLQLPLAILLVGLLLVATRRSVCFQAFGLCGMQQAALLATNTASPASPFLALMLVVPALPILAAGSLWLARAEQAVPQ